MWTGEHEERENEENVVECGEAAEDLNERSLELNFSVIEHYHGEEISEQTERRNRRQEDPLDDKLERA